MDVSFVLLLVGFFFKEHRLIGTCVALLENQVADLSQKEMVLVLE